MTFPVPDDANCTQVGNWTVTFTFPACPGAFRLLLGQMYELANEENYDDETGASDIAQQFQDAIDLAIYGQSP